MPNKILIYTTEITPRVEYIFDFILNDFSGLEVEFTSNKEEFLHSELCKINFSKEKFSDEIHLISDEFMFETGINENVKFQQLNEIGKLFFALSRYEEYWPQPRDIHDRISGMGKVYKRPFVDAWILEFQQKLKSKFPQLNFKKREFEMILTCDVDQAWKYKHKGLKRSLGAFTKDLIKGNLTEINNRKNVIFGKETDPFDTFDYFKTLKEKHNFKMIFFWLMADYAQFDKNNPTDNYKFQEKIKSVSEWSEIGIHPSYASNFNPEKLNMEISRLEKSTGQKIIRSRQHYIKLKLPETYRNLIANGIQEDYTMAYADEIGFRAGCCSAFYWYDLKLEKKTELRIHPHCAMDVTLRNYKKLNPQLAAEELLLLKREIQKVNGAMITLFHNSNFNEEWKGWKSVLESILH